ncbi:hypothetical protein COE67_11070 [Priestia megaterium]|uniref:hypothetical protein n=1 Tax=Priestia megaterium TaxID=1404 RepID=UPI000BFD9270|nr:hypothetical protein [Priestia megaterium]PGX42430.1 hypothetical protein COE67_11070 [Priestia megaterium]
MPEIKGYTPMYQRTDKKIDRDLLKRTREQHDKAKYLLAYYELNKKHIDLPDDCYDTAIRAYLTLSKIANRTDLRLFEFKELSLSTTFYLSELHILLLSENKQGILEFPTTNYEDWYVSFDKLRYFIRRIVREKQSIAERLENDLAEKKLIDKKVLRYELKEENAESDIGSVKIKPFYVKRQQVQGVTVEDPDGQDWSAEDMKKLATDLLAAAELKEKQATKK